MPTLPIVVFGFVLLFAALRRFLSGYPRPRATIERLAPREVALLDTAAEAMFPAGGSIPVATHEADLPGYVDRWFRVLHPVRSGQIRMLFVFFEHSTLLFPGPRGLTGFRRFSSQPLESRIAILRGWHESRFFVRRLIFTALRAVLTMAYLGHPGVLRHLHLAPFAFDTPVCEADLLFPPVGKGPDAIPFTRDDLTPPSNGTPISLDSPIHSDYEERLL